MNRYERSSAPLAPLVSETRVSTSFPGHSAGYPAAGGALLPRADHHLPRQWDICCNCSCNINCKVHYKVNCNRRTENGSNGFERIERINIMREYLIQR